MINKKCIKCNKAKQLNAFGIQNTKLSHNKTCLDCRNLNFKRLYKLHHMKYRDRINLNTYDRRHVTREIKFSYLLEHPCVDCGIADIRVLEFDHLQDKKHVIALMQVSGIDSLIAEISKCDIRCANCHRIKTFSRAKNKSWRCT